jgi:hypothetical protein
MLDFAEKCKANPEIKMLFVGDYNRNIRAAVKSKLYDGGERRLPAKIFQDLKPEIPNWDIGLWRYPVNLEQYDFPNEHTTSMRELAEVHHPKWFVSDNDILISGASQGDDLFYNRKDRYWLIRDCKELCDYAMENMQVFYDNSYQVNSEGDIVLPSGVVSPDQRTNLFKANMRADYMKFINKWAHSSDVRGMTAEEFYDSDMPVDATSVSEHIRKFPSPESVVE